jgi:hypothetical protein
MSIGIETGLSTPMSNRRVPIVDTVGEFGLRARTTLIHDHFKAPSGTVEKDEKVELPTTAASGDPNNHAKEGSMTKPVDHDYEIVERPITSASPTGKSEARIAAESSPEKNKPLTESPALSHFSADMIKVDERNRQMGEGSVDDHRLESSSVRPDSLHTFTDGVHPVAKATILFLTVFQQLFEYSQDPVPFFTLFHILFTTPMLMRMGLR